MVAKRAAEACERAIKEMSADLHDNVTSRLVILKTRLDNLDRASPKDHWLRGQILKMQLELDDVNIVVRYTMLRLTPMRSKEDTLVNLIKDLCVYMDLPGTARIEFTNEGEPVPLGDQVELYIFRIIQELLQNAVKHSSVWHIRLLLQWQPGTLTIEVEDDGTRDNKINKFIRRLKEKDNSLKMRTLAIGASINYKRGKKGLLAIVRVPIDTVHAKAAKEDAKRAKIFLL